MARGLIFWGKRLIGTCGELCCLQTARQNSLISVVNAALVEYIRRAVHQRTPDAGNYRTSARTCTELVGVQAAADLLSPNRKEHAGCGVAGFV